MGDLAGCGDFVSRPHPGIFFCFFKVLLIEEFVERFIVFAGVFCLKGAKGQACIDFWLFGLYGGV